MTHVTSRRKSIDYPAMLDMQCQAVGLPAAVREFKFHPTRKWRADLCWPGHMLAVECEGGVWVGGRHTSGAGFTKDMEKYNALALAGYTLLRFTPAMVRDGIAVGVIETAMRRAT